ncbi:MAG: XisI protein [Hormoscilla sp. GM7CHS1pb]|nr:XisI protein [Hormoscilla sp. GM7CHS1pb]
MEHSLNYADILKQTLQEATRDQPSVQAIKVYPVCDTETGHFLVLATGYDKQRWMDSIIFHARLLDPLVVIELDNFEDGLTEDLIAAGIPLNILSLALSMKGVLVK